MSVSVPCLDLPTQWHPLGGPVSFTSFRECVIFMNESSQLLNARLLKLTLFTPNDNGPIYSETLLGDSFLVEPWNTWSNIVFLFIIVYWTKKLIADRKPNSLLVFVLPVLTVGFVGGTFYHGSRSDDLWRVLDFGAIYVLLSVMTFYLWAKILGSWETGLMAIGLLFLVSRVTFYNLYDVPESMTASRGYVMMALNLILPLFLFAARQNWKNGHLLSWSLAFFAAAISLRQADAQLTIYLPQGTHFLWHIFGGISTHYLISYFYLNELEQSLSEGLEEDIEPSLVKS